MRFFWWVLLVAGAGLALMLGTNWIRGLLGAPSAGSSDGEGGSIWASWVESLSDEDEEEVTAEDESFWVAAITWPFAAASWGYEAIFGDEEG